MTERKYQTDRYHSAPYGRIEEIIKGDRSDLPKKARYLGILRQKIPQFAWDRGPHAGSIDPGCRANENFGTYDIALKFGFCEEQAHRIATKCYDVDRSQTHYHDPDDRSRLRITGTPCCWRKTAFTMQPSRNSASACTVCRIFFHMPN
jgi:hypothetical protein